MFSRLVVSCRHLVKVLFKPFAWCVIGFICVMLSYAIMHAVNDFLSLGVSREFSNTWYYLSSWWSYVLLALCGYLPLSYTSILNKGVLFSLIIFTASIAASNTLVYFELLPNITATALTAGMVILSILLVSLRFIIHIHDGDFYTPSPGNIYLIINKPRTFIELLGMITSGFVGGFTIYHDGFTYWFSRKEGVLVKTYEPDWYKGKRLIYVCESTPENIDDLDSLPGRSWSFWNNCVFTPLRFKRRWLK